MDFKKITRNPLFYVLLIGIFLIVGFSLISTSAVQSRSRPRRD